MFILSPKDRKLLQTLTMARQENLLRALQSYLEKKYETVYQTNEYLMAVGDIPIALVAHLDTVFKAPPSEVFYDAEYNVMWSPEGLGADDRAGVFAIFKILQTTKLRPTIIFTTDEEYGGLGAEALIKDFPKKPPVSLNYIIELDRKGKNDCVFYDCNNKKFVEYIQKFGFEENIGTFTDISIICPAWGVAGVNLSIGYRNEHTISETLHIKFLFNTISKIKMMLREKDIPFFEYIPFLRPTFFDKNTWYYEDDDELECAECGKTFSEYELIPVRSDNGFIKYFCPDCAGLRINWCEKCGNAFEVEASKSTTLCNHCHEMEE